MKKLTCVLLALLIGAVACDRDASSQATDEATPNVEAVVNTAETASTADESLITPADISEEAQNVMYQTIFDYNQCMMASRLTSTQDGQSVQQAANDIMSSCETHMDDLAAHLLSYNVNESLVIGMGKKMRSRAARKLMTGGMNQMAAQASAVENAEKMQAE
ncbi:MAG: hypothetical protein ACKE8G_04815 [Methylophagaceae bacterium]